MTALPLDGSVVHAASWPAAAAAGTLLGLLGAEVRSRDAVRPALCSAGVEVDADPPADLGAEDEAGIMALTGRADGPPLASTGQPATIARAATLAFELLSARHGRRVRVDGRALLTQRAGLLGGSRRGHVSVGGAARLLRGADGWWALTLARPTDFELVPALVEESSVGDDPWPAIGAWSRQRSSQTAVDRAALVGLAAGRLGEVAKPAAPWRIVTRPAEAISGNRTRVVNLGALWAGPLAAQLLALTGAEVIDVESTGRPDGSRLGTPQFYAGLHQGHELVQLDFGDEAGRRSLRELIESADVVIEASRPRALQALGVDADSLLADGRARTWIRITGHGPDQPARIGFGDDAAVAGGLVGHDTDGPVFAGDAIADPLTGLLAAVAAIAFVRARTAAVIDLSLRDCAAWCRR